jgi:hypothetical protein
MAEQNARKDSTPPKKPRFQWFWVTRTLGTILILFGVFGDHTPERGTIILTGAGLLGFDKVARSDGSK